MEHWHKIAASALGVAVSGPMAKVARAFYMRYLGRRAHFAAMQLPQYRAQGHTAPPWSGAFDWF